MHVHPSLREPALLLAFDGWNDAGEAATSAARFVSDALACVPLAELDPEEFYDFTVRRPCVRQGPDHVRRIEWPASEFRFGAIDPMRDVVVGIAAEPHLRWRRYCDLVLGLVATLRIRRAVLLGAYLADVVYSRPVGVTGFASSERELARLTVQPSGYEGPTGIVGVLADRLQADGVEVVSLWAGLPHYITASPNPRGALALVKKITECLAFRVDETPLVKDAAEFEERIAAMVAADPELSDYVRELKRREFAQ